MRPYRGGWPRSDRPNPAERVPTAAAEHPAQPGPCDDHRPQPRGAPPQPRLVSERPDGGLDQPLEPRRDLTDDVVPVAGHVLDGLDGAVGSVAGGLRDTARHEVMPAGPSRGPNASAGTTSKAPRR